MVSVGVLCCFASAEVLKCPDSALEYIDTAFVVPDNYDNPIEFDYPDAAGSDWDKGRVILCTHMRKELEVSVFTGAYTTLLTQILAWRLPVYSQ